METQLFAYVPIKDVKLEELEDRPYPIKLNGVEGCNWTKQIIIDYKGHVSHILLPYALPQRKEVSDEMIYEVSELYANPDVFSKGAKWMRSQLSANSDAVEFAEWISEKGYRLGLNENSEWKWRRKINQISYSQYFTTQELYTLFKNQTK